MNYTAQTHCKVCHDIIPLNQVDVHNAGSKHISNATKKKIISIGITKTCNMCGWYTEHKKYEKAYNEHLRSKKHKTLVLWYKAQKYKVN